MDDQELRLELVKLTFTDKGAPIHKVIANAEKLFEYVKKENPKG